MFSGFQEALTMWVLCVSVKRQTVYILQKYGASAALYLSTSHDRNAIAKKISFVHEMCWQDHRTSSSLTLKDVPRLSSCLWIHSRRRLIQEYDLTTECSLQRSPGRPATIAECAAELFTAENSPEKFGYPRHTHNQHCNETAWCVTGTLMNKDVDCSFFTHSMCSFS